MREWGLGRGDATPSAGRLAAGSTTRTAFVRAPRKQAGAGAANRRTDG